MCSALSHTQESARRFIEVAWVPLDREQTSPLMRDEPARRPIWQFSAMEQMGRRREGGCAGGVPGERREKPDEGGGERTAGRRRRGGDRTT
ncbi:hypothetical protein Taro_015696 [Colocasia esculenta]|uniref:Uncharacterized protein n=1 Tax=Colocasia esculenta TaxID=4460 RepID=A0A843UN38_COLES|nr:hypothetical protein [Colocasia esculenta]